MRSIPRLRIVVTSIAMEWVGDECIDGPEATLVRHILYQALQDAKFIANRSFWAFAAGYKPGRMTEDRKMKVIQDATIAFHDWLGCDQFNWYCHLLGFSPERVRLQLLGISMGISAEDIEFLESTNDS